jgi:tRNA(Leu) C34 or U34 (ribose-2'-O)-methylase TrmL
MTAGSAVLLIDPKFAHNVGGALRACAVFGAETLAWTPQRVAPRGEWPKGQRLPREERIAAYRRVQIANPERTDAIGMFARAGFHPVAVELRSHAESLPQFVHPARAVYVFGPEDGSLSRGELAACYRFVCIPTTGCMNLAAAINVVLYDRVAKQQASAAA